MTDSQFEKFRVGDWTVERATGRLSKEGHEIQVRPKVMDVLVYLAQRQGTVVSSDEIIKDLWEGTFVASESVYFSITQLRKALGDDSREPKYIETISKRGYRLIAPLLLDEDAGGSASVGSAGVSPLNEAWDPAERNLSTLQLGALAGAGLAILAALLFFTGVFDIEDGPPTGAAPSQSIAVLPFVNMSSDPEQEYFSDGMSEEILNMLAQVPDLKVAARTSSFQFKGQNLDVQQIAGQLRVSTILEGSVRRSGDQVRVAAQLIKADDGFHLWSEVYDRELDDVFAIQDDIASAIVTSLIDHLGLPSAQAAPAARIATATEAYDLYLQGKYHLNAIISPSVTTPKIEEALEAREWFERSLMISPDFAPAWAGLATADYWLLSGHEVAPDNPLFDDLGPMDKDAMWEKIKANVATALELGPNLAEVQFAAGFFTKEDELDKSLLHLTRAIEINPNMGEAHANLALTYEFLGRYTEAFASADQAFRVDPLNQRSVIRALYFYLYFGRPELIDDVLAASERVQTIGGHLTSEAYVHYELGQFDVFPDLESRANAIKSEGDSWAASAGQQIGDAYLTLGLEDRARPWMRDLYDDIFLMNGGRFDDAIDYLRPQADLRLAEDDDSDMQHMPDWNYRRSHDIFTNLAQAYFYAGRFEELIDFAERLDLDPAIPPRLQHPFFLDKPWIETAYAYSLLNSGREEEAQEWLANVANTVEDRMAQGVAATNHYYELARLRAMQGRPAEAFAALEQAVDRGWRRWFFGLDPMLAEVRALPEYTALKARYDADITRMREAVTIQLAAEAETETEPG